MVLAVDGGDQPLDRHRRSLSIRAAINRFVGLSSSCLRLCILITWHDTHDTTHDTTRMTRHDRDMARTTRMHTTAVRDCTRSWRRSM